MSKANDLRQLQAHIQGMTEQLDKVREYIDLLETQVTRQRRVLWEIKLRCGASLPHSNIIMDIAKTVSKALELDNASGAS